jgi:DNA-binding response OmpR family regulator
MSTFHLDGQALLLAPDLERELVALGHEGLSGPDNRKTAEVLILGEAEGLEREIRALRGEGVNGILLTLRRKRDSARSALLIGSGADDDVLLPVTAAEIQARVRALMRVSGRDGSNRQVWCGITVFPDGRAPEAAGRPLPLSVQEGRVLSHLVLNQGRFVPRSALLGAISASADQPPSDRVVDVHICNLRRKLRAAMGAAAPRVLTGRGRGYQVAPPGPGPRSGSGGGRR